MCGLNPQIMRSWLFLFNSLKRLAIESWSNIKLAGRFMNVGDVRLNCYSKSPRFSFWLSSNIEICVIIFIEKHSFLMWFEHLHYTPLWLIKGAFLFVFIYTVMEEGLLYSKWR